MAMGVRELHMLALFLLLKAISISSRGELERMIIRTRGHLGHVAGSWSCTGEDRSLWERPIELATQIIHDA